MKMIYAVMEDGSQTCHKLVANDFDVEGWAEKWKGFFQLLGIKGIQVETLSEDPQN